MFSSAASALVSQSPLCAAPTEHRQHFRVLTRTSQKSQLPSRVSVSDDSSFLNIRQLSWFVPCDGDPVSPTPTLFRGMNKACLGKLASGILTVCWDAVSTGGGLRLWEAAPPLTSALLLLIPPCFSSSLLAAGCNLSHSHANNTDSLPSTVGGNTTQERTRTLNVRL